MVGIVTIATVHPRTVKQHIITRAAVENIGTRATVQVIVTTHAVERVYLGTAV